MANTEGFDPTLLPAGQGNEEPQLDQFRFCEVPVQLFPQLVIGDVGIPQNGAGVPQRRLFPVGEPVRVFEAEQLVVIGFGESLPSSLDGPLDSSVVAVDGFGNIHSAQLFE